MSITHEIKNYWELIIAVFTGLGSLVGWLIRRKKNKQTSTQMLYEQMEVLKKKIILQTANEITHATAIAEKDRIIENLRVHCPECYIAVMDRLNIRINES